METNKHRVFISYHHGNDSTYKEELIRAGVFVDYSVDTGDIDDNLSDQTIRQKIRDEYLRDSTVTIVLVGTETKNRKHVDWEIYSSMYDGQVNKKSGILVINLPSTGCTYYDASHGQQEKNIIYPHNLDWVVINARAEYERRYPFMPSRIIDNLLKKYVNISVTNWNNTANSPNKLQLLIDWTFRDRATCNYDLSAPMRRSNS